MVENRRNLHDSTKTTNLYSSMAEVSYVHLHGDDEDHENEEFLASFSPRSLDWSQDLDVSFSDLDFSFSEFCNRRNRRLSDRNPIRISSSNPFDQENQVNFVFDMISTSAEQSCSSSRILVENDLIDSDRRVRVSREDGNLVDSDNLEIDFGLGLGFPLEDCNYDDDCEFMVSDCVDRSETYLMGGFSVADSDEDRGNEIIGVGDDFGISEGCDDEATLTLCWDAFQLEDNDDDDHVRWGVPTHQHFEWEEVDGPLDVRDVLNVSPDAEPEADNWEVFLNSHHLEANPASADDLEWEVFLNVDNIDGSHDLADQFENYDDAEHEMLFGQFVDNGDLPLVQPPASKRVVENLMTVVVTPEDVENDNTLCAVCKDEIGVGEMAKRLPCTHHYHGDCIVPWLCIRNTCPVCRHELPTDDPSYERRKAERVASDH